VTKRITATEHGLAPHWKVRVVIPGAILHLASKIEPCPVYQDGRLTNVEADWLTSPEYGDTVGYIDWPVVTALTWRYAP
jgi:hypothetical protein